MILTDAIIRARQIKLVLDKRVDGFMEVRQMKTIGAKADASMGVYGFTVFIRIGNQRNINAVVQTVRAYGGKVLMTSMSKNPNFTYEIDFKLGET